MDEDVKAMIRAGVVVVVIVIGLVFGGIWAWKSISVWSKEQNGKATLAEARYSRQVAEIEAQSNLEAEKLNAQAEVERAKGAAEAIEIEAGKLTENYIRYLWVRNLERGDNSIIYVPTEAGLPVLEAGRIADAEPVGPKG